MAQWRLSGDILHASIVLVEADTLDEAIAAAELGEFTIEDEQNSELSFIPDNSLIEKDGKAVSEDGEEEPVITGEDEEEPV